MMISLFRKKISYSERYVNESNNLFPRAKVAIVGGDRELIHAFNKVNSSGGQQKLCVPIRKDLSDDDMTFDLLRYLKPDFIINLVFERDVDKVERDPARCRSMNYELPIGLAILCKELGSTLVQLSSDYVFDGNKKEPYVESDQTSPVNLYGQIILEAEQEVNSLLDKRIVLRTGGLFDSEKFDLISKFVADTSPQNPTKVISDEYRSFVSLRQVAQAIIAVVDQLHAGANAYGTYHFSSITAASDLDIAQFVFERVPKIKNSKLCEIFPVEGGSVHNRVLRPKNLVISSRKILDNFGIQTFDWQDELERFMTKGFGA